MPQSPSGKPTGEIRVVLQFTHTVIHAAPLQDTVLPPAYSAPYGAFPAHEGSSPHAIGRFVFKVILTCIHLAAFGGSPLQNMQGADVAPLVKDELQQPSFSGKCMRQFSRTPNGTYTLV